MSNHVSKCLAKLYVKALFIEIHTKILYKIRYHILQVKIL